MDGKWQNVQLIHTTFLEEFQSSYDATLIDKATIIWWRRPFTPQSNLNVEKDLQKFVSTEKKHALHGSIYASECRVVNSPFCELKAQYKPYQLRQASKLGLMIPETCITNDANKACEFATRLSNNGKRCIYKPFTSPEDNFAPTRILTTEQLEEATAELTVAPVIFQECIEKGVDIRVCVVGDKLFSAAIIPTHADLIDWRLDPVSKTEHYNLPEDIKDKLFKLTRALGLETGSIDLRVNPDGQFYFFEINPSGQFLWLEADLGLPICDAFADLLLEKMS
jgi:glutathione synthase/RimK-type ligase-like ATP-grasp enzyme